jgi:hypothetical protein
LAVVYALIADMLIFNEKITPGASLLAVLVLSVTIGVSFYKMRYEIAK